MRIPVSKKPEISAAALDVATVPAWVERREDNKRGLFDAKNGTGFVESVATSIDSLNKYGARYKHWVITYSGGKDSSALMGFTMWAIENGHVARPQSLTVLYADTYQELPPLAITAKKVLLDVQERGYNTRVVAPRQRRKYWVNMLGRGVIRPSSVRNRWCTRILKADPMNAAMRDYEVLHGEGTVLFLTGVRKGESMTRDQRITTSCSTTDGECGQGWFQQHSHALAPLLQWRVCWIWKWLYNADNPLPSTREIVPVYVADEYLDIRTGCIACGVLDYDTALHYLVKMPEWAYLAPLLEIYDVYKEMHNPSNRLRRGLWKKKDGTYSQRSYQLGPLTIPARRELLARVLDIQQRANYVLIDDHDKFEIAYLCEIGTYPQFWTGDEKRGDEPYDKAIIVNGKIQGWQKTMEMPP